MNRDEAKILIARQIAIFNGLVWERIMANPKLSAQYITLAGNILATIERKANCYWGDQ